jgi:hypothetical protein
MLEPIKPQDAARELGEQFRLNGRICLGGATHYCSRCNNFIVPVDKPFTASTWFFLGALALLSPKQQLCPICKNSTLCEKQVTLNESVKIKGVRLSTLLSCWCFLAVVLILAIALVCGIV